VRTNGGPRHSAPKSPLKDRLTVMASGDQAARSWPEWVRLTNRVGLLAPVGQRRAEARTGCVTVSLSPGRDHTGPVTHDCFEAGGRGDPRSRSMWSGVDAQLAVCGNEGDVSLVEFGSNSVESNP
jgi:hypothetical protein